MNAKWAAVLIMAVGVGVWAWKRRQAPAVSVVPARDQRGGVIVPPDVFTGPESWVI